MVSSTGRSQDVPYACTTRLHQVEWQESILTHNCATYEAERKKND